MHCIYTKCDASFLERTTFYYESVFEKQPTFIHDGSCISDVFILYANSKQLLNLKNLGIR